MDEGLSLLNQTNEVHFSRKTKLSKLCISSKGAFVILMWNFAAILGYKTFYNIDTYMQVGSSNGIPIVTAVLFGIIAAVSPLIGFIADIKISRYRAVICSSYATILAVITLLLSLIGVIIWIDKTITGVQIHQKFIHALVILFFGAIAVLLTLFRINGFQFGMDQLQSSSTEDLVNELMVKR